MFGYSSDELIGQPMTIITPPAFRDVTAELYRRFLETGQGLRGEWDACTKTDVHDHTIQWHASGWQPTLSSHHFHRRCNRKKHRKTI